MWFPNSILLETANLVSFYPLNLRNLLYLIGSSRRSCQPPAMGNPAFSVSSCADTLPALRFTGVQGMTTSRGRRQRLHPLCSGTVPVRQHREAHPDPSRRNHRTRAIILQPSSAAVSTASSGQAPHRSLPRKRESSLFVLPLLSKSNPLRRGRAFGPLRPA